MDLAQIVQSYHSSGEDASHDLTIELLHGDTEPWMRSHFDPGHFTSSGFVVSPSGDSVLLILHGKLHRWLQPGGHMEAEDSSAEAAARREILEETGIGDLRSLKDGPVRIDVHEISERDDELTHLHFDLGFGFQAANDRIGPLEEVVEAEWVKFEDLDQCDVDDAVRNGAFAARDLAAE